MNKRVIECAVIGYGPAFNMGNYHMNLINATPGLKAVAVCDTDPSRLEAAKNDFPGIDTYNSVDELLDKGNIDLTVVVTPHNTHAPIALKCLRGRKTYCCRKAHVPYHGGGYFYDRSGSG